MPRAHSALAPQTCPVFLRQVPAALQVVVPVQESGSSALVTDEQVPGVSEQDWQLPLQALLQQRPSAQKPEAHSPPAAQICPGFLRHEPVALQVVVPEQVSASSAFTTAVQLPGLALHDLHAPLQDTPQQTPSKQNPEEHSAPREHAVPSERL
jgi:hypothetical protein